MSVEKLLFWNLYQLFKSVEVVLYFEDCAPKQILVYISLKKFFKALIWLGYFFGDSGLIAANFVLELSHLLRERFLFIERLYNTFFILFGNYRHGYLILDRLLIKSIYGLVLVRAEKDRDLFQLSDVAYGENYLTNEAVGWKHNVFKVGNILQIITEHVVLPHIK